MGGAGTCATSPKRLLVMPPLIELIVTPGGRSKTGLVVENVRLFPKSAETFQGGWTKSGDKYFRDPSGNYVYAGRSDDMLKVSGQFVSPFEVEATLMKHAAVLEAALIGTPDASGITRSKAFVAI